MKKIIIAVVVGIVIGGIVGYALHTEKIQLGASSTGSTFTNAKFAGIVVDFPLLEQTQHLHPSLTRMQMIDL